MCCLTHTTVNGCECCNDMTQVCSEKIQSTSASFQHLQVSIQTVVPPSGHKKILKLQAVVPQGEPACPVGHNCKLVHHFHMRTER